MLVVGQMGRGGRREGVEGRGEEGRRREGGRGGGGSRGGMAREGILHSMDRTCIDTQVQCDQSLLGVTKYYKGNPASVTPSLKY